MQYQAVQLECDNCESTEFFELDQDGHPVLDGDWHIITFANRKDLGTLHLCCEACIDEYYFDNVFFPHVRDVLNKHEAVTFVNSIPATHAAHETRYTLFSKSDGYTGNFYFIVSLSHKEHTSSSVTTRYNPGNMLKAVKHFFDMMDTPEIESLETIAPNPEVTNPLMA